MRVLAGMSASRPSAPSEPPPPLLHRLGGLFLVLHGLAHAAGGRLAVDDRGSLLFDALRIPDASRTGLFTVLWLVAMVALMAAGFGWLGAGPARPWPRAFAWTGVVASLVLFALRGRPFFGVEVLIDVLVLVALTWPAPKRAPEPVRQVPGWRPRGLLGRTADLLVTGLLVYVATVVALHPAQRRWGATDAELARALPGDELMRAGRARPIHRAISVRAPAPVVWSYVVQVGQGRAGWEAAEVVPGRALVLRGRGALVVEPVDAGTSRLLVRTHAADAPLLMAPFDLLVFEPARFVMERRMLLTIRDLAERDARAGIAVRGAG